MAVLYLLTGSYAGREEKGIKLWQFDTDSGALEQVDGVSGIARPSFLAIHPTGEMFVSGSEDFNGELASFEMDWESGKIAECSRRDGNGDHPAYVTIDRSGEWLLSVNYSGGNVNVFRLPQDRTIGEQTDSVQHEGSGPNKERQDAAHPHSVIQVPERDLFAVSDLGTDAIYFYQLHPESGKLSLHQALHAEGGSGPRHLAYHPDLPVFYSLGELSSTITVYSFNPDDSIDQMQRVSLLPAGYKGENTAAEVAVSEDGKILYASNRGHDSIVSFEIGEDGRLQNPEFTSSGGQGPRHFTLVPGGDWLIVANEKSDSLTVLKLESGRPVGLVQEVETDSPVCVKFIERIK
ncbi:lactonase family protein [Planococcus salinarum]|uniref:lactonase family protein n=1 Tax=Planococcus salinarum TaxID=622695 RepID=UPI000E3BA502|nr:lactonase family protein [Planococcus salinarum]TAA72031.1 lactonase family protein [Planococcus salinarum]